MGEAGPLKGEVGAERVCFGGDGRRRAGPGGKLGRLPPPWGPYRARMNPGSRGSVEEQVRAVVADEAGTQLMWFRVSPVEGPVGQGWACHTFLLMYGRVLE